MSAILGDLLDKLRAFAQNASDREADTMALSHQEVRAIVQEIDHLRSVAGAVSRGESFAEIKRRASPKTEPM